MSETFDVIVAGAGMAGGTAALALASGGLKVALIDALPLETRLAPTFDGRAYAIAYSSFRMLKAIGVGARLEPVSCRIEQILVTDGRSPGAASGGPTPFHLRFAAEEIAARSEGEPLGYMVENRRIRAALAESSDYEYVHTSRGLGYRFEAHPKNAGDGEVSPVEERATVKSRE